MTNLKNDFGISPRFIDAVKKLKSNSSDGLYAKDKEGHFMINKVYKEIFNKYAKIQTNISL